MWGPGGDLERVKECIGGQKRCGLGQKGAAPNLG
jgi:hypothetical protein